jgi:phosphonate transport system substrate-binding protein
MRTLPLLFLAGLAAACGDRQAVNKTLTFSAIPDQDETRLRAKFEPVAEYLSERLGVPVAYLHAASYDDAVEHFKNGDVQLAWFGGLSGVRARHAVKGARAIAQGEEDPQFYSYFIAHRDAGIEPSAEFPAALAGKRFTFGSSGSTSGRLMPEHFIRMHTGKSPAEFFGRENHYADSHDQTIALVASGAFEAGAVNYAVYDQRVKEGKVDPAVCRVIWKTPTYADYNFTAHPELESAFGPGFTGKLQRALLEMTDPQLLSAFPRKRLIEASNADFAAIEQLAAGLGFLN